MERVLGPIPASMIRETKYVMFLLIFFIAIIHCSMFDFCVHLLVIILLC